MGMHAIFPDIVLIITPFTSFLKEHLVVRRRRSTPPLTASYICVRYSKIHTLSQTVTGNLNI
jgi:hypothetical protein